MAHFRVPRRLRDAFDRRPVRQPQAPPFAIETQRAQLGAARLFTLARKGEAAPAYDLATQCLHKTLSRLAHGFECRRVPGPRQAWVVKAQRFAVQLAKARRAEHAE